MKKQNQNHTQLEDINDKVREVELQPLTETSKRDDGSQNYEDELKKEIKELKSERNLLAFIFELSEIKDKIGINAFKRIRDSVRICELQARLEEHQKAKEHYEKEIEDMRLRVQKWGKKFRNLQVLYDKQKNKLKKIEERILKTFDYIYWANFDNFDYEECLILEVKFKREISKIFEEEMK